MRAATASRSRRTLALAGVAAALLLSGCRAEVGTRVEVTGDDEALISVSAVFTEEAAEALASSTQGRSELTSLFESRTGARPQVTSTDEKFVATVEVGYSELETLADITGVEYLTLSEDGTLAEAGFAPATRLVETITEQNSSEPDGAALTTTMLANTHLVIEVSYPGGVGEAEVRTEDGAASDVGTLRVGDTVARFDRTADVEDSGTFVVAGDPTSNLWRNVALGGAVLVAAAALAARLRRR